MNLAPVTVERLVESARRVRTNAYAPYSRYLVGAAVLAEDGRLFAGCNVENAAYPLGMCAERNAVGAAVAAGARPVAVAVVTQSPAGTPCGACRQVLAEFGLEMPVIMAGPEGDERRISTVAELLPQAFRLAVE